MFCVNEPYRDFNFPHVWLVYLDVHFFPQHLPDVIPWLKELIFSLFKLHVFGCSTFIMTCFLGCWLGACQFIVQEIIFKFTNQCKLIVSKDWKIETPIDKKGWTEMISHSIFMMQFYPSWIHNNVFLLNHFHFWRGSQNHYRILRDAWIRSLNKKTIRSNPSYGLI